ncbi:VrrA/YqfQ family protein [Fictibacillus terranigra]|uniref:VrrA/YqfQ family protein n=1 Tax=Fictibacillus terranigra TaxID=3058424 RepID=A0ABT8EA44_9BACL|nr:VrrA/YqfQ family protein [Fictibacillus sp. CENA-BCM004]MDN4074785.1 VrrA/YqfQ family protein [Fictibacillus sp. CENA-BCM004]
MHPYPPIGPQRGRSAGMPPGQRFAAPAGMRSLAGLGGAARSPLNVLTMVENVQKMLQIAETMGPMFKQYGPMVKNLPDMMKSLKEFKDNTNKTLKEKKEARNEKAKEKKEAQAVAGLSKPKKKEKPKAEAKPKPVKIELDSEMLDESSFPYDIPAGTPEDAKIIIGPAAGKVKNKSLPAKTVKKRPVKRVQPPPKLFI